jgi:hypothetical protein
MRCDNRGAKVDEQARFDVTPLWPATDGPGLLALELLDRGLAADVVYAATGLDPLSQSYAANERRRWLMRHVARAHDVPARLLWGQSVAPMLEVHGRLHRRCPDDHPHPAGCELNVGPQLETASNPRD